MPETKQSPVDHLRQLDHRASFLDRPIQAGWLTVYHSWAVGSDRGASYSVLVPSEKLASSLTHSGWDLSIGQGGPGCTVSYEGETEHVSYDRVGDRSGNEPLVIIRDFHGIRPRQLELVEEFRLFHNLFFDTRANVFLKFDDAGNEEEVVRLADDRVTVRAKELREFLAIKEMHLVLQFDSVRYSALAIDQIPKEMLAESDRDGESCWTFNIAKADFTHQHDEQSFSRLVGKRAIMPVEKSDSNFWPYKDARRKNYPEFLIGTDDHGESQRFSCDPSKLANYFGANPGAPHYLTPVFFRREVLQKYYGNAAKYTVDDGAIWCAGLWTLRIDNHLMDLVSVYLGDLGRDLPSEEWGYWLSFNVVADAGISTPKLRRDFLGEFADPERPDLLFKYRVEQFNRAWLEKHGWPFFLPLQSEDQHLLIGLREPLTDDQGEFDSQVLALTKLMIDSLNEKQLVAAIGKVPAESKGIAKFELYLQKLSVPDADKAVSFLRDLQALRSTGVGHRKGSGYEKARAPFKIVELGRRAAFRALLERARSDVLEIVGDALLPSGWRRVS